MGTAAIPLLTETEYEKLTGEETNEESRRDIFYRDEADRQRKHNRPKEITKKHAQTENIY